MEKRYDQLVVLKYMAKDGITFGWHPNCGSCCYILSIEESYRKQVIHHTMREDTFIAYHMILGHLEKWEKSNEKSASTHQEVQNTAKRLCEKAEKHFLAPEDKECFKTMVQISKEVKTKETNLFQCDQYEHYMRSLNHIAGLLGAEISKKQIDFYYLLTFDYPLLLPLDKKDNPVFEKALKEWDQILFTWMHKPGDVYRGKELKEVCMMGLYSPLNDSLNCHGQQQKNLNLEKRITSADVTQQLKPIKTFQMSIIFNKDTYPSVEEIKLLIQEGMDINLVDEKGLTPLLHLADPEKNGNENLVEIVRILIQNGADVNSKNKDGKNVLHLLCGHYQKEDLIDLIILLIENGIDINSKSFNSENALFYLFKSGVKNVVRDEIVKLLLRHGIQFSEKYYKMLRKSGMEKRHDQLDVLKYMAKDGITFGWHPNCGSCCYILSIEESYRKQVIHHTMREDTFIAYHMILGHLENWEKSNEKSAPTHQQHQQKHQQQNTAKRLCEKAEKHFLAPEDKECFKTMVQISKEVKTEETNLFQCDQYEHYMRSLNHIAGLLGAEISKKQIDFYNLLTFDYPLLLPLDKKDNPVFEKALKEWDQILFTWMHKPGDVYRGKELKEVCMMGLYSPLNDSLNCHGQQQKNLNKLTVN